MGKVSTVEWPDRLLALQPPPQSCSPLLTDWRGMRLELALGEEGQVLKNTEETGPPLVLPGVESA